MRVVVAVVVSFIVVDGSSMVESFRKSLWVESLALLWSESIFCCSILTSWSRWNLSSVVGICSVVPGVRVLG